MNGTAHRMPDSRMPRLRITVAVIIIAAVVASAAAAAAAFYLAPDDMDAVRDAILIDATYHPDKQHVEITYADHTRADAIVAVEVLGMRESYRKEFAGPDFDVLIGFESAPKYGWAIHPVVADVDHPEFGPIQIKTEVHERGAPAPDALYVRR